MSPAVGLLVPRRGVGSRHGGGSNGPNRTSRCGRAVTVSVRGATLDALTAAVKQRYLSALGFRERPIQLEPRAPAETERSTGPATGRNEPGRNDQSTRSHKDFPPAPHVVWSSSDGEWERTGVPSSKELTATPSEQPHTLAGTVAIETTTELDAAWARYKKRGRQADRDELIVYYAPLVKYVAGRIGAGLPQTVDPSDLVSYGMFGLIDAITKFDPERGFKFETYAISRIKGAILDELRSIDWVPRSVRSKAKSVERAMAKLESELHRAPTDEEIAGQLDISVTQLNGIYKQISSLGVVALDEMLSYNGSETLTFGDTLADRRDGPGKTYERVETRQLLAEAINKMNEREKIVLTLYYYENLTLAEIGKVLGVTESRICQIHTKAVLQLRSRLESAERELV